MSGFALSDGPFPHLGMLPEEPLVEAIIARLVSPAMGPASEAGTSTGGLEIGIYSQFHEIAAAEGQNCAISLGFCCQAGPLAVRCDASNSTVSTGGGTDSLASVYCTPSWTRPVRGRCMGNSGAISASRTGV